MPLQVLVVTKGHPYDYNGFHAMFDENPDITHTCVEQPAAQVILRPQNVAPYDAIVFYDMWGIPLDPTSSASAQPPADYVKSVEALLEAGKGLVLLNHALVQWPQWPLWREISGTTFLLYEGRLSDGKLLPGSGYRGGGGEPHRNATHHLKVVDPRHPVTKGLGGGFDIVDELYLRTPQPVNADIVPLLTSDYAFTQANFNPPPLTTEEEKSRWNHPNGNDVIVWAKRTRNSPVVASEAGDGPAAYANPAFRTLLNDAIHWVASDEARAWARGGAR
jgi:hypothetical protein